MAIAVLSVGPAGSFSLLLSNTSSALGPIPLTFCPFTGRINYSPLVGVLLIGANPGLVTTKLLSVLGGTRFFLALNHYEIPIIVDNHLTFPHSVISGLVPMTVLLDTMVWLRKALSLVPSIAFSNYLPAKSLFVWQILTT